MTNSARMDDPIMCRNLVDYVPPPGYWASLCNLNDEEFLDRKFVDSSEVIQQRDAEIVELKSKLGKAEDEAAGVVEVRKKVSELETTSAVRTKELASFSVQNAELSGQVEGEAKLKERFMAVHDDAIWCLTDRSCALDARLSELSCQARYEEAVKELQNISLPFLARLESYKDAPLERDCSALSRSGRGSRVPGIVCREVLFGEALEASHARAQKHRQAASSSLAIVSQDQGISTPHVADVPPLNSIDVEDYTFSDGSMLKTTAEFGPPNPSSVNDQSEAAHDYMFDTTLLDKPVDP
ncbi:hypothetical protein Tco_1489624 [Tanacetum coccineum]